MSNVTVIQSNEISNLEAWLENEPLPPLQKEQFAARYPYLSFKFSQNANGSVKMFTVSSHNQPPLGWFYPVNKFDATPSFYARQALLRELKSGKVVHFPLYEDENMLHTQSPETPQF